MENNFPKYQYSKFIGQDQIVVRTDDKVEFENMVGYVKNFGKATEETTAPVVAPKVVPNISVDKFEQDHTCPTHGVAMKLQWSKTKKDEQGNFVSYYSHSTKVGEEWQKCFGKGYKSFKK